MRMLFGVLSLLFVVAAIGFLAKKQLSSAHDIQLPEAAAAASGTVQQQALQIQQQIKAAAEAAVQQPRPMPDDK